MRWSQTSKIALLSLFLSLGLSACACSDDEEVESEEKGSETSDKEPGLPDEGNLEGPGEDGDEDEDKAVKKASSGASGKSDGSPLESRADRLRRIADGDIDESFKATVISVVLDEGSSKVRFGSRQKGIQAKITGVVRNGTDKTLHEGFVSGVLILRFGDETVKVQLSPDGLKPELSSEKPWRPGTSRLFEVETFVYPKLMLEYTPDSSEVRLMVVAEDPVDYKFEAPVWKMKLDWLAARGAPVKGTARVLKTESLRVGPRGKTSGKTESAEKVELLYQKGEWVRVKAGAGVGWVPTKGLLFDDITGLFDGASPHSGGKGAGDDLAAFEVKGMSHAAPDPTLKLKEGERLMVVEVSLTNKGEKDIKCTDFFVDFGPKEQVGPHKVSSKLSGAIACEKDKLAPGTSATGKLAFLRTRHQVPFAVGYSSPSKSYLLVDVYDKAETRPHRN